MDPPRIELGLHRFPFALLKSLANDEFCRYTTGPKTVNKNYFNNVAMQQQTKELLAR